jgi:alanine racemase
VYNTKVLIIICTINNTTLLKYDITPVVSSYENAAAISEAAKAAGRTVEALVAVDTGMGRIGFLPDDESIAAFKKIGWQSGKTDP